VARLPPLSRSRSFGGCARWNGAPSAEALEEAEIEAALAAHDEWVAAGCPGAQSHEDVMAELLGGAQ
jgi:hypothetical protein